MIIEDSLHRFGKGHIGTGVQAYRINGSMANAGPDLYFVGYSGYTMFTGQMFFIYIFNLEMKIDIKQIKGKTNYQVTGELVWSTYALFILAI